MSILDNWETKLAKNVELTEMINIDDVRELLKAQRVADFVKMMKQLEEMGISKTRSYVMRGIFKFLDEIERRYR